MRMNPPDNWGVLVQHTQSLYLTARWMQEFFIDLLFSKMEYVND